MDTTNDANLKSLRNLRQKITSFVNTYEVHNCLWVGNTWAIKGKVADDDEILVRMRRQGVIVPEHRREWTLKVLKKELAKEQIEAKREAEKTRKREEKIQARLHEKQQEKEKKIAQKAELRKSILDEEGVTVYDNESMFVDATFRLRNLTVTPIGDVRMPKGKGFSPNTFFSTELYNYNDSITPKMKEVGIRTLSDKIMLVFLEMKIHQEVAALRDVARARLIFNPDHEAKARLEFNSLLKAIRSPKSKVPFELDYAAMRHIVWQIKRRFFDKDPYNVLVMFFYGYQGCGKTTLMRNLTRPLKEYYSEQEADSVTDARNGPMLERMFIIGIEELAGVGKVGADKLKALVTKQYATTRVLGTHITTSTKVNVNLMGTSNRSISAVLRDETGMRRWYQVYCPLKGEGTMDFQAMDKIDWDVLWTGTDENCDKSPLFSDPKLVTKLKILQESWRHKYEAEEFAFEMGYWPATNDAKLFEMNFRDFNNKFKAWCEAGSTKAVPEYVVRTQLIEIGVQFVGYGKDKKIVVAEPNTNKLIHMRKADMFEEDDEHTPTPPTEEPADFDVLAGDDDEWTEVGEY